MADLREVLAHRAYPRSNRYDPAWVIENQMGPNALWLVEALTQAMPIEPGAKVLDLGCGRAMTSIFLAKEFGARVWATDLWIPAEENERRIREAGVEDLVEQWISQLSEKQQAVLERRFGLHGYRRATLEQIGAEIGVTRERVRQIQLDALKALRTMLESHGISGDVILD